MVWLLLHTFSNHSGNPLGGITLSVSSYSLGLWFSQGHVGLRCGCVCMCKCAWMCYFVLCKLACKPEYRFTVLPSCHGGVPLYGYSALNWLWMLVATSPNRGYRTAIPETSRISVLSARTYAWPCSFCSILCICQRSDQTTCNFTENRNTNWSKF